MTPQSTYISGPMSKRPDFNFPAFMQADALLEAEGVPVRFNPAAVDIAAGFNGMGLTGHENLAEHGFVLRDAAANDLTWIAREADSIYLLDGWRNSSGARAEFAAAQWLDLLAREEGTPTWVSSRSLSLEGPSGAGSISTLAPLVGLLGAKGSGKDTAALALTGSGYVRDAFADTLKQMAYDINPFIEVPAGVPGLSEAGGYALYQHVIDRIGGDRAKNEIPDVRRYLQRLGTEGGRDNIDENVWVDIVMRRADRVRRAGTPVVVTDVRFPNEVAAVRAAGGLLVRVVRPGLAATDTHRSETEVSEIPVDITLVNDASIDSLQRSLLDALGLHRDEAAA